MTLFATLPETTATDAAFVELDACTTGPVALPGEAAYDALRLLPNPDGDARVSLAVAAAHVGDTATARETLRWLESRSKRNGADLDRAFIQLALGQRDSALASLRAAYDAGVAPAWTVWHLRPELDPLRNDPRFVLLVRPTR